MWTWLIPFQSLGQLRCHLLQEAFPEHTHFPSSYGLPEDPSTELNTVHDHSRIPTPAPPHPSPSTQGQGLPDSTSHPQSTWCTAGMQTFVELMGRMGTNVSPGQPWSRAELGQEAELCQHPWHRTGRISFKTYTSTYLVLLKDQTSKSGLRLWACWPSWCKVA